MNLSRTTPLCSLTLAAFTLACGADIVPPDATLPPPDIVEPVPQAPVNDDVEAVRAEPTYVLNLEGKERVSFFVDEDGSVGVLGEVRTGGSILDHVSLRDASPAVIYHAISPDPVPAALLDLHKRLLDDGEVEDFELATDGRAPGWMLSVSQATSSSPCLNATFNTNHCAHGSYDDYLCKFNSSGSWNWRVGHAHRYKAGFCVQQGDSRSELTYSTQANGCTYFRALATVWGRSFFTPEVYSATTYLSYVWWRPSGAARRSFRLTGGFSSGDVFDWGQRWSRSTACD